MKKFASFTLALATIAAFATSPASARTPHHATAQSTRSLYNYAAPVMVAPAPSNGIQHYPDFALDPKTGSAENRAELGY